MKLSAQPLKNYQNVNSFQKTTEWSIRIDEENTMYLQLIDLEQDGLRYIPSSTPTPPSLQVIFPAVNSANIITKEAVLVSVADFSLWSVSLLSSERPSTGNVQFVLTEGTSVRRFVLQQGLVVEMFNQGSC